MTPEQWLAKNERKPWHLPFDKEGALEPFWYWGTIDDYDPDNPRNDVDEIDNLLPAVIFGHLRHPVTYPNVKEYDTKAEALEDFFQAFQKAVDEGWDPEG